MLSVSLLHRFCVFSLFTLFLQLFPAGDAFALVYPLCTDTNEDIISFTLSPSSRINVLRGAPCCSPPGAAGRKPP